VAEHTIAGLRCSEVADLAPAFVLGALEAAESDAVRRHLGACPEAHPEMAELHSVVPALFEAVDPVAAPAGLRERILAAAAADARRATRGTSAVPVRRAAVERAAGWSSLFRRPVWAAISLAAALAVVALGAWNVQLQNEIAGLTAYRDGVVEVLEQAARPGAQLAVLAPPEGQGPSGLAAVAADGRVALVMRGLAPTKGSQVYETWLIGGDGTPVPIGGFTVSADGSASFVTAHAPPGEGVVVALTLEPGRGARTPTKPIIAAGKAQAQTS
jgi:hypothetical protein